jgi:hypothetical protein
MENAACQGVADNLIVGDLGETQPQQAQQAQAQFPRLPIQHPQNATDCQAGEAQDAGDTGENPVLFVATHDFNPLNWYALFYHVFSGLSIGFCKKVLSFLQIFFSKTY